MADESRVMVVNAFRDNDSKSKNFGEVIYAEIVADLYLGCMGYNNGWNELFDKDIDFDLYAENDDEATREDKHGDIMKEGNIKDIIGWLENVAPVYWGKKGYRRIPPFLGLLKGINPTDWDELHIVHYGY